MEASMKRAMSTASILAAAACVLAASAPARAQSDAPKPGPEHKKLEYFAGKWTSEAEAKKNPFGPAGKYTGKDDCSVFQGGFAIVCHSEGTGPMGATKSLGILGYSAEEKVYTYYGLDNSGMVPTTVSKGSLTGDTWVYTDESKMGGKPMKSRYTMKQLSPTSYTFKWEMQDDKGAWATLMDGKATKAN
jgi:hypothetical protein